MFVDIGLLIGAAILAALGGELFLKGIVGCAETLRLPPGFVATTVAAFATSAPELTVSTVAAIANQPAIGLGDSLGSNVVNIGLVLGVGLLFGPVTVDRTDFLRTYVLALAAPLFTGLLALDGNLNRIDGIVLIVVFASWVLLLVHRAVSLRTRAPLIYADHGRSGIQRLLLMFVIGIGLLTWAGQLFVKGATGLAIVFGLDLFVLSAVIVAIGTSMPELVTMAYSRLRGNDEIALGTLLGSNLFNGLAVVGLAATISPIPVVLRELAAVLGFGVVALLCIVPDHRHRVMSVRGLPLIGTYLAFVVVMLRMNQA